MRRMSAKTVMFLSALKDPDNAGVSTSTLAKKYKIAAGYAYKLAARSGKTPVKRVKNDNVEQLKQALQQKMLKVIPMLETQTISIDAPLEPVSAANAVQVGGGHYQNKAIQPWDYIVSNRLGYLEGNVVKYVSRWQEKGGRQDLEKARHYLDKLLEVTA
jgi:Protein of unknwon function (DUF3310)